MDHKIIEELLLNEDFKNWVINPASDVTKDWNTWLAKNRKFSEEFYFAREIICNLKFEGDRPGKETEDRILESILNHHRPAKVYRLPTPKRRRYLPAKLIVAASLTLAILSSVILYFGMHSEINVETANVPQTIIKENPAGRKSRIFLPDGSLVWLNHESRIEYAENFKNTERRVKLMGEAYFEVVKDSTKPFVVHTEQLEVMALGTAFNVSSHNSKAKVSLSEGKVRVLSSSSFQDQPVVLDPGEYAVVGESPGIEKGKYDEKEVFGWIRGIIYFKETTVADAFTTLEKWYGKNIILENADKVSGTRINAEFDNQTLVNVLEGLKFTLNFTYKIDNENVKINFHEN